jgi:hypothetical protein
MVSRLMELSIGLVTGEQYGWPRGIGTTASYVYDGTDVMV